MKKGLDFCRKKLNQSQNINRIQHHLNHKCQLQDQMSVNLLYYLPVSRVCESILNVDFECVFKKMKVSSFHNLDLQSSIGLLQYSWHVFLSMESSLSPENKAPGFSRCFDVAAMLTRLKFSFLHLMLCQVTWKVV